MLRRLRALLRHLATRWSDWCGDRELELAIRRHLAKQGYYGDTARLQQVRLVAVQRPGWVQIYRFDATARLVVAAGDDQPDPPPQYHQLFGLVRDDARADTRIRVFREAAARRRLFADWSEDLICLRGAAGLHSDAAGRRPEKASNRDA